MNRQQLYRLKTEQRMYGGLVEKMNNRINHLGNEDSKLKRRILKTANRAQIAIRNKRTYLTMKLDQENHVKDK